MNGIVSAFEGHLPADAELKFSAQGTAVLNFSLAVWDAKKREDAETEWVRCAVWGDEAERLAPTLKKGSEVYCEGRVKLSTWNAADGATRSGLNATVWTCVPKGAIGHRAPPRPRVEGEEVFYATERGGRGVLAR